MQKTILLAALLSTPARGAQETMAAHIRFQDTASIHLEKGKVEMQNPPRQAAQVDFKVNKTTVTYE